MKTRKTNENKKARRTSLLLHLGLLVLGLYPLKQTIPSIEQDNAQAVEIVFTSGEITSGSASTAPAKVQKPVSSPVEKTKMTPKAIPEIPSAPVLEQPDSPVEVKENSEAARIEPTAASETVMDKTSKEEDAPAKTTDTSSSKSENNATSMGEGDSGEHITGKALGEKDFGGEGDFGRKVIYRAPIANAAKESGVVTVNVCINRAGRVTHAIVYKAGTTIKNKKYIDQAKSIATQYRFEKDYTAPTTQCGRLTFIFKIKNI